MFNKKICGRCRVSVKSRYDFCPFCGNRLQQKNRDFGMLGKNDFVEDAGFNSFGIPPAFNLLVSSLAKSLGKQFKISEKKADKPESQNPARKGHISISISAFGNKMPVVKVSSPEMKRKIESPSAEQKKKARRASFDYLSPSQLKKFSQLPREEPKTNIRRLSNKVFYELDMPGVKSAKDISILNLEKGVELKAVSDKKAYSKSIPISLPIINYKLSKGKLILEMDARGD